jgi:hypothetical protein
MPGSGGGGEEVLAAWAKDAAIRHEALSLGRRARLVAFGGVRSGWR